MNHSIRYLKQKMKSSDVSAAQTDFLKKNIRRLQQIRMIQCSIFLVFIVLWEVGANFGFIDPFIFSSPSRMAKSFWELSKGGVIYYHIFITLAETFISFLLVMGLGILVAVLFWWNNTCSKIFEPYLVVLNSLPKTALAPVFIVWLGNNMKTIVVAAVSVAVFGSILTLYTAFTSVEDEKIKLIQTLGGTKKDCLTKVVLPSSLPAILSNMKVNIGLSLVGVIIGEFLAANEGLGYLIIYSSQVFKLDYVMLSICILCVIATVLYKLLNFFEKKFTH